MEIVKIEGQYNVRTRTYEYIVERERTATTVYIMCH